MITLQSSSATTPSCISALSGRRVLRLDATYTHTELSKIAGVSSDRSHRLALGFYPLGVAKRFSSALVATRKHKCL